MNYKSLISKKFEILTEFQKEGYIGNIEGLEIFFNRALTDTEELIALTSFINGIIVTKINDEQTLKIKFSMN